MITKSFHIGFFPGNGFSLQWRIDGVPSDHTIRVERAEGSEGPWKEIDSVAYNVTTYLDDLFEYRGVFKVVWYRLQVLDADSTVVLTTKPVTTDAAGNLITNEIIRQHLLTLEGVNGHPGYLGMDFVCYKKMVFGEEYDLSSDEHGEALIAYSVPDQNTKHVDGWSTPIPFRGRWIDSIQESAQITPVGDREEFNRQLWLTNIPVIEHGDIIAEKGTGRVYEVRSINKKKPGNILVSQTATCAQIDPQTYEAQHLYYPGDL